MMIRASVAVLAMVLSGAAYAASPSQAACEADGGTFTREQGVVMCVDTTEENVGNSSNSQTTTTTTTTSGQGNTGNKTTTNSTCTGPGTSTSSAHCR
jgi:ABC-type oligopeptide transport system substrate-binding subunit